MGPGIDMENKTEEGSRRRTGNNGETEGGCWKSRGGEEVEKESMMMELTKLVQKTVKESSWWEKRGIDCSILAAAFLCLPLGKSPTSAVLRVCVSVCVCGAGVQGWESEGERAIHLDSCFIQFQGPRSHVSGFRHLFPRGFNIKRNLGLSLAF